MATLLSDSSGVGPTTRSRPQETDSLGLGELLRRAREDRGLSLEQISNETKIPQRHLEALEHDNLAAVPGGFYRRAEIRAYAQAVHLDQSLALALLERTLKSPVARGGVPEHSNRRKPALSRQRVLTVIGVVVAAAVLGRVMGGRESALDRQSQPPDAVVGTSHLAQPDAATPPSPPAPSEAAPTALEPAASPPSNAGLPPADGTDTQASAGSVTEFVVTTDPPGTRVTVNGIGWGTAPVTIRYLPPGEKRVRVSMEGYVAEERLVDLVEGRRRTLDIRLRRVP